MVIIKLSYENQVEKKLMISGFVFIDYEIHKTSHFNSYS